MTTVLDDPVDADEVREALRFRFEETARWRRAKAKEYPNDGRNTLAAEILDELVASVDAVEDKVLCAYGELFFDGDIREAEELSEQLRQIGFYTAPSTAAEFVGGFISDRTGGR
jgi:hypothetical protein